ncbi:MAG: GDP-mannose 4,6-dehydratase [Nitrospinae bacterium]|nr:GDP-mannose 4,6-dehydratase [Nitrospinota bacterium]
MGKKKAVIVGLSGQDGHYLNALLSGKGYEVTGLSSTRAIAPDGRMLPPVDITNPGEVETLVRAVRPDEVYYLAAVHQSSQDRMANGDGDLFIKSMAVNVVGLVNFLNAAKKNAPGTRLFYAASSHVFGAPEGEMQDERTPFDPVCIYGISKTAGVRACRFFHAEHGVFASAGILFNHESPVRKPQFVSRKIVDTAKAIKEGREEKLVLGNLDSRVDWGYAPDFADAMHRILQADGPDSFVVATGELHSIREFVEEVFGLLGLDWQKHVTVDPSIVTKKPRHPLAGKAHKLRSVTGWRPSVDFPGLIRKLVEGEAR